MTHADVFYSASFRRNLIPPVCLELNIPSHTFLVRFDGTSDEFGRAIVLILARRSQAKIPMARPNEPDMPSKRTKMVRLGIYRTHIEPNVHSSIDISGQIS